MRTASALALLCVCLVGAASAQRQRGASYTNPALAGDFPDPSVIRVGADYWATATSSEWAPEFPIMHSRDLVNWKVVGAVFQRRPEWSNGNYWAPEISEYRGRFFVYFVGHKKNDGPLCVGVATATKPAGPYTDRGMLVCQDAGSIDAMPVTNERGERYLVWKEDGNSRQLPTPIWAQKLSSDGTKLTGEKQELIRNDATWEAQLVEGPFIMRRDGWFYMFYSGNACCGRECNYAMGVARSRKLLGPWEKNQANPILKGNDKWKCPGHGSIVADSSGRDFLLYHAYQAQDFVYVGRQALLDEVQWKERGDGWPSINGGAGPSGRASAPHGFGERNLEDKFTDDFNAPRLLPGWQWPQASEPVMKIEHARGGWLVLSPKPFGMAESSFVGGVVARSTTVGNYVATTLLDTRMKSNEAMGGLSAYGDAENALGVAVGAGKVIVWKLEKNSEERIELMDAPRGARTFIRMTARDGYRYRFAVSNDGRNWKDAGGEVDGSYLPPWDRGVRVALTINRVANAQARFDWLRIMPSR
jgi:beta-xylosidase